MQVATQNSFNMSLPPFAIGAGSASTVGRQIARAYEALETNPPLVTDVWRAAAKAVKMDQDSIFFKVGLDLSAHIDAGNGTGIEKGYHNTQHYIEVLLNATHLVLRNNHFADDGIILTPKEIGKTLFAALAHDFDYVPGGNKHADGSPAPYRLEMMAFKGASIFMQKHEISPTDQNDVGVLIFGTDVSPASKAGSFIRAAHLHIFQRATAPAVTEVLAPVVPVLNNERLLRMAGLVADADILSSAGLTIGYGNKQTQKLGVEWGKQMGPQDTLGFLNFVAENSFVTPAARFFNVTMDRIRTAAEQKIAREKMDADLPSPTEPKKISASKPVGIATFEIAK